MLSSLFRVIQFKKKNEDNMLNVGDNINESTFIKMGDLKVLINLVEKDKKTRVFSKDCVANIQFFFSNVHIKWIITQSFFFNKFNYI